MTKRTRGDMLAEDFAGTSEEINHRQNSGATLAGYSIPKKTRLSSDDGDTELKENPSVLDSFESAMESCSKAYTFKPPPNRVARKTSDGDSFGPSTSAYSNKSNHRASPRDEAQPLGKSRKWAPPLTKTSPKKIQEIDGSKCVNEEIAECPPGEEPCMDLSESRTSNRAIDETLPLTALG